MFLLLNFRISCKSTRRGVPFCDRGYSNFFFLGSGDGGGGRGGVNALHETAGCHCSCGAGEAMSPLLKSRCTTLILFIDKTMETIAVSWFFKVLN